MDDSYTDFPALYKKKWVCFFIHKIIASDPELLRFTSELNLEIISQKLASRFIIARGKSEEVLVLIYETTHFNCERFLKNKIRLAFEEYYKIHPESINTDDIPMHSNKFYTYRDLNIDVEENYMHYSLSTGGWDIFKKVTSDLMYSASNIFSSFIVESKGEWTIENSIQKQIPFIIILLNSFGLSKNETSLFLEWIWKEMISNIDLVDVIDTEEWYRVFLNGIQQNYASHQEFFSGYTEYILDALNENTTMDEEWLNTWRTSCQKANIIFKECLSNNTFIIEKNSEIVPSPTWIYLQTVMHSIHNVLGINMVYEYNIIYSIKESLLHRDIQIE